MHTHTLLFARIDESLCSIPQGHVYLMFADVPSAQGAAAALNGRWFAQKQIVAMYMQEAAFVGKCPGAAGLG